MADEKDPRSEPAIRWLPTNSGSVKPASVSATTEAVISENLVELVS